MRVMVTGGAGYIGGHIVACLVGRGDYVLALDDMSTGRRERVRDVDLVELDISRQDSSEPLRDTLSLYGIDSVIHCAAKKSVPESLADPLNYLDQNVSSVFTLLNAVRGSGVRHLVFSSSAAVYGDVDTFLVDENAPTKPINPYGLSKLIGEQLIASSATSLGLSAANLRYFNVAGSASALLSETAGSNLIPQVIRTVSRGERPIIFGNQYKTRDGTCVRDFIHVSDLASAHLSVLDHLAGTDPGCATFNVGTGRGATVGEIIDLILDAMASDLTPDVRSRRDGDPASVVASSHLIRETTAWAPAFSTIDMVRSAVDAYNQSGPTPRVMTSEVGAVGNEIAEI